MAWTTRPKLEDWLGGVERAAVEPPPQPDQFGDQRGELPPELHYLF
jgi:hypothetical protein